MFRIAFPIQLLRQLGLLVCFALTVVACAAPRTSPQRLPAAKAVVDPVPTADVDFEPPVAPPFDRTLASTVWEATRYLFEGDTPSQQAADPSALDSNRVTLMHGTVFDAEGGALPGVRVGCMNQPELGYTFSDAEGRYDLALNGGGQVILDFTAPGYLRAQRRVSTTVRSYGIAPEVGLLRSTERASILVSGNGYSLQGDKLSSPLGKHQAFIVVEPGTRATLVRNDGTRKQLNRYHLRVTVYPETGVFGTHREPGSPTRVEPASPVSENELAYTYEVRVDEADAEDTATVEFSQPLKFYLTNYLGLNPGGNPFVRSYNFESSEWQQAGAGQLLRVIRIRDGIAGIDINRDGTPETGDRALAIDFSENEALELGARLELTDTAYRTRIKTTGTFSASFLTLMEPPYVPNELPVDLRPDFPEASLRNDVRVETLATRHSIGVAGAPFDLVYQSDRTSGYRAAYRVTVPVLRTHLPFGLTTIYPILDIAGQRLRSPEPLTLEDRDYTFEWDGRDAQGRLVQGRVLGTVWIGYGFYGQLSTSQFEELFLQPSNAKAEIETVAWRRQDVWLGSFDASPQQLGGLMVDVHHHYDPEKALLYRGDGTFKEYDGRQTWITPQTAWQTAELQVQSLSQVASGPNGALYLGANLKARPADEEPATEPPDDAEEELSVGVLERKPDGSTRAILGEGAEGTGGEILLSEVTALAVSPSDGLLYVLDAPSGNVYGVSQDGEVTLAIGDDDDAGIKHRFAQPRALAVGPSGQLYIADGDLVVVAFGDALTLFAGAGANPEAESTQSLALATVSGLAVEPTTGDVFVSSSANNAVYQISSGGYARRVAGVGRADAYGDGSQARDAALSAPGALAIARDGSLLIADTGNRRIRRIYPDGIIDTWAGGGTERPRAASAPSGKDLGVPSSLAVTPSGDVQIVAQFSEETPKELLTITASAPSLGGVADADRYLIPSSDGSELYEFDQQGRHQRTLDGLTAQKLLEFEYDAGLLVALSDSNSQKTTIERTGDVLISPARAAPTRLTLADDWVGSVVDAAGDLTEIQMAPSGLLESLEYPTGEKLAYDYDEIGYVRRVRYPGLEETFRLDSVPNRLLVSITANDAVSFHTVDVGNHGSIGATSVTDPDGAETSGTDLQSGISTRVFASGAQIESRSAPLFTWSPHAEYPASTTLTTASGTRKLSVSVNMRATANVEVQGQTVNISAASADSDAETAYEMSGATFQRDRRSSLVTGAGGRSSSITFNSDWLPQQVATTDLWTTTFEYDNSNQVTHLTQANGDEEREVEFTIGPHGLISKKRSLLGGAIAFGYDALNRPISMSYPDEYSMSWDWDSQNRLRSVRLPDGEQRELVYRDGQLLGGAAIAEDAQMMLRGWASTSNGPAVETYKYTSGQLSQVRLPDERTVDISYTPGGRLQQVTTENRETRLVYAKGGTLISADTPDVTTSFVYDSPLLVSIFLGGVLRSTIDIEHDDAFRQSSVAYGTSPPVQYEYDVDSNLATAGPVSIQRDPTSKFISGWSVGHVTTVYEYDSFGEPIGVRAEVDGTPLFSQRATRNSAGKIISLTETSAVPAGTEPEANGETEVTVTHILDYDDRGQLVSDVIANTALLLTYDARGNRSASSVGQAEILAGAAYSEEKLTTANGSSFSYSASGDLLRKTRADGSVVSYTTDEFGNLLRVKGSTDVKYRVDAFGRRVTRSVGEALRQTWIYHQHVNPIAEVDSLGAITRFVYASRKSVPDAVIKDGETYAIVTDLRGSVRRVVDETNGEVLQELDYDTLGRVTRDTNPGFQPFGFAGGLYDPDTQLVRLGTRDYDPELGRFLMRTSVGGRPQLNAYVYAGNDPLGTVMPDGRQARPLRETFAQRFVGTAMLDAITEAATSRWGASSVHAAVADAASASRFGIHAALELGLGRPYGSARTRPSSRAAFVFASDFLTGLELALSTAGPYLTSADLAPQEDSGSGSHLGSYFGRCTLPDTSTAFEEPAAVPGRDSFATEPWRSRPRGAVCE